MRFKVAHRFLYRATLCAALALSVTSLAGCDRSEKKDATTAAPAKIEPVAGMKYYVGGPQMRYDKYNRMRLAGFNGEVSNPTTRGLLLGFKKNDDGTFDYRTWLNGAIISQSTGFLDDDGLLWYRDRISYDANGAVVVRQKFTYDDERKVMQSTLEHIDPADGSVVKTVSDEVPYTPPAQPDDEDIDADDEEDTPAPEGGEAAPAEPH
jgi:hypothetical protein